MAREAFFVSIEKIALLAVKSFQSAVGTGIGASGITKNVVMSTWPELQSFLWKRYGPVVMTKWVYPLARRTVQPLAKKVGMPIARKFGVPLAQRTGRMIWRKAGQPAVRKVFPKFFEEKSTAAASGKIAQNMKLDSLQNVPKHEIVTHNTQKNLLQGSGSFASQPQILPQSLQQPSVKNPLQIVSQTLQANSPQNPRTDFQVPAGAASIVNFPAAAMPENTAAPRTYQQSRLGRRIGMGMVSRRTNK
jgi:hypothetical protein